MKEVIDKIINHYDNGIMLLLNNLNNKYIEEIDKTKMNAYTSGLLYSLSVIARYNEGAYKDYIKEEIQKLLNKYKEIK